MCMCMCVYAYAYVYVRLARLGVARGHLGLVQGVEVDEVEKPLNLRIEVSLSIGLLAYLEGRSIHRLEQERLPILVGLLYIIDYHN